ncbi:putative acetyl xylan esterase [Auriculariales sp. MPI-PUGE-AT-0066]|nr:putative acetyl xylan esterase [Auriculariales sp. MPI-PUGE-AT-0066]
MHLITAFIALAQLSAPVLAASLQQITNFGSNPTGMKMWVYRPDSVQASPPVLLAMHGCGGNGQQYFSQTQLPSYADRFGFILVYPDANHDYNCFDVASANTQKHNSGGDSLTIIQMVNYTLSTYAANPKRVYALGQSSGGMMTNTLLGSYPDVFAAGSPYSAFPFACLQGGSSSPQAANLTCSNGQIVHTDAEWAQLVYNAYPGYTGARPSVQVWHGTADFLVNYNCFIQELKQWSTVLNVTWSRNVTNSPASGYTEMIYGDGTKLRAFSQANGGHVTPMNEETVLRNFGLLGTGATTTTTTRRRQRRRQVAGAGQGEIQRWLYLDSLKLCSGYSGCTTCAVGSNCIYSNAWYSQCL